MNEDYGEEIVCDKIVNRINNRALFNPGNCSNPFHQHLAGLNNPTKNND